jgi:hypothetical protein
MVDGQEVTVQQTPMKDETGTISKVMTRQDVQNEMVRQINEIRSEYNDKLTPEQQKAADKLLSRLQQFIAMVNMFLNAMISDTAATTTYNIEAQFKLAEFLQYQATFNDQMASKLDIIEAAVLEIRRKK